MLEIAWNMNQLPISDLLQICKEALEQDARERYDDLPPGIALEYAELDLKAYLRDVFFQERGAYYALWQEKGRYVSALRMVPFQDGMLLHSLHTHPDFRRRGYANGLIRGVLSFEKKQRVYSHVKKDNAPSLFLHEKCGFAKTADSAVYLDGSTDENAVTFCKDKQKI